MSDFQLPAISTAIPLPCSRCGTTIPPGDVMWDEKGPVCDGCITAEIKQLSEDVQIHREKAAYRLGRVGFLEKQIEDFKAQLREQDARGARP